jgi:mRNA-degrading endonuclease YafQ of YafQ-DinJ toxin-antitoxin module
VEYGYTTLFERSYAILSKIDQNRIDNAIKKLCKHPYHPFPKGLRIHKLDGVSGTATKPGKKSPDIWEMHASQALLITFQYAKNEIIFRNCGQHNKVLQSP